jgi:hypothetical protein
MRRIVNIAPGVLAALAIFWGAGSASAASVTLATFADPSPGSSQPLFQVSSGILSGNWINLPGLTLQTPGLDGGTYPDAQFRMTNLTVGAGGVLSGGSILFQDSASNNLFTINFDSGQLFEPIAFGSSDFSGNNVTLTGPIVPAGLSDEHFSFAFSNRDTSGNGTTYTAAFTLSGVPEPASLGLLGCGMALLAMRRRAN